MHDIKIALISLSASHANVHQQMLLLVIDLRDNLNPLAGQINESSCSVLKNCQMFFEFEMCFLVYYTAYIGSGEGHPYKHA